MTEGSVGGVGVWYDAGMRLLLVVGLLVMSVSGGCRSAAQVVSPGSRAYEARVKSLALKPEAAWEVLTERGVRFAGFPKPLALVDRWYLFGRPYKYARIDLEGYYVNGDTGAVEYRASAERLEAGKLEWPGTVPKNAYIERRLGSGKGPTSRPVGNVSAAARVVGRFEIAGEVEAVGVCEAGHRFAAATKDHKIVVADLETGRVVKELEWEGFSCERLRFSRDGEVLFARMGSGLFNSKCYCEVWRVRDGRVLFSNLPVSGAAVFGEEPLPQIFVHTGDLSPDGRTLLMGANAAKDGGPTAFELRAGQRPRPMQIVVEGEGPLLAIQYSRDGQRVACVTIPEQNIAELRYVVLDPQGFKVVASRSLEDLKFIGFAGKRMVVGSWPVGEANDRLALTYMDGGDDKGTVVLPSGELVRADLIADGTQIAMLSESRLVVREKKNGSLVADEAIAPGEKGSSLVADGNTVVLSGRGRGVEVWTFAKRMNDAP